MRPDVRFVLRSGGRVCGLSLLSLAVLTSLCHGQSAEAQPPQDTESPRALTISEFRPQPQLKVRQTNLTAAKFPAIDTHTHFRYRLRHSDEQLHDFVKVMDRNNI